MVIYYLGRVCACFIVTRFTFELKMNIRQINLIYSLVVKIHNIIKKIVEVWDRVQSCPSYKKENVYPNWRALRKMYRVVPHTKRKMFYMFSTLIFSK